MNNFLNRIIRNIKQPRKWIKKLNIHTLGVFKSSDYTKFIVISRSRSGSNLLRSLLNNHSAILVHGEIFGRVSNQDYLKKLNEVIFEPQPYFLKAVGFKLFYYHPVDSDASDLWDIVKNDRTIKIIHLTRKKIIRTLISRKIAEITDQWSSYSEKNEYQKVTFSKDELVKLINETLTYERETRINFKNHQVLEVTYEDLVKNQEIILKSVFKFLNVEVKYNTNSVLKKQNTISTSNVIDNYDQLLSDLSGTEYEKYLYD